MEEIFPFGHYGVRRRRIAERAQASDILQNEAFRSYTVLSIEELHKRLEEERSRSAAMDEKTFKLTLSLSVGLTILGSTATFMVKNVAFFDIQVLLLILLGLGLFYVLGAGFLALESLRTLPSFGYGTQYLLQQKSGGTIAAAEALARQETMNQVRHLRNEAAYQSVRNGLLLIFASLLIFVISLGYHSVFAKQESTQEKISLESCGGGDHRIRSRSRICSDKDDLYERAALIFN